MARGRGRGEEEGGGHDTAGGLRWLLTYADMITLLMAFFLMMYSMSVLNLEKFKSVAISIRSGFGGSLQGGAHLLTHPEGQRSLAGERFPAEETKSMEEVAKELQDYIKTHKLERAMQVRLEERGLVVTLVTDNMLFPIGSAELRPPAREILERIAEPLKKCSNPILVEGHTCDLPISRTEFPSNWELSAARASRVVRHMIEEYGIEAKRFSAVGRAATVPKAPNDSEADRRRNRRVDIVILAPKAL